MSNHDAAASPAARTTTAPMRAAAVRATAPPAVLLLGAFPPGYGRGPSWQLADRLRADGWAVKVASHSRGRIGRALGIVAAAAQATADVAVLDVYSTAALRWAEWSAAVLGRRGVPYVAVLHGGDLPRRAARSARAARRVRGVLAGAAAVTAPSAYLQREMAPYAEQPIRLLPNPIDLGAYPFRRRQIDPLAPRLVWVRALHEMYNPVLAVEVLRGVRRVAPGATLTFVGPDKDGSAEGVRYAARQMGVAEAVTLVGAVEPKRVPGYLAAADIFLNTTDVDNTPMSVLEAAACGLPVVSTDAGGLPDLLTHGETGLLSPCGFAEPMVAHVCLLLRAPEVAARLAHAGRAMAAARAWDVMLPAWMRLLQAATSR